jgi:hypothetical protein
MYSSTWWYMIKKNITWWYVIIHITYSLWMKLGGQQMALNDIPLDPTEFCLPQKGPRRTFWPRQNGDATTGCEPAKNGTRRSAEGLMVPGLGWILRETPVLIVENDGKWWSTRIIDFDPQYVDISSLKPCYCMYVSFMYRNTQAAISRWKQQILISDPEKRRKSGFIMVMICYTHLPTQICIHASQPPGK